MLDLMLSWLCKARGLLHREPSSSAGVSQGPGQDVGCAFHSPELEVGSPSCDRRKWVRSPFADLTHLRRRHKRGPDPLTTVAWGRVHQRKLFCLYSCAACEPNPEKITLTGSKKCQENWRHRCWRFPVSGSTGAERRKMGASFGFCALPDSVLELVLRHLPARGALPAPTRLPSLHKLSATDLGG